MRPQQRKVLLVLAVVALGAVLALPSWLWGHRWGYPIEYGYGVLALVACARTRFEKAARRAFIALYAITLLFLVYDELFPAFFHRDPALVEDWKLAVNLYHFVREMKTWRWALSLGAIVAGSALLFAALGRLLGALQARARPTRRALSLAFAAWTAVAATSLLARGPLSLASAKVAENYRASKEAKRRLAALDGDARDDRYRDLMKVRLARRPNFYLLLIEAYGQVLATWDMVEPYRALMDRVRARLERAGYHARTAYSTAPIHGGRSWLSIATVQTGIAIDVPTTFAALEPVSRKVPTIAGFFHAQGYTTASLEPGTNMKTGPDADLYPDDLRFDAAELRYTGPKWGYGTIPDRYAWDQFRARGLGAMREPRYVFYMATSTHYPWTAETIHSYDTPDWPPLPGMDAIGTDFRRWYMKSVDYEWHVLTEVLEADPSPDVVIVIVGDHQPRLESNQPGEVTFETPIHVLSRDADFVDPLALLGFERGMFAEPGRIAPVTHAGLFSLVVSQLAARYGTPETRAFGRYAPEGISLAGLKP